MPENLPESAPWKAPLRRWKSLVQDREEQVFLVLTLLIGALVGLLVVAFILITERFGARLYPAGGAPWRRLVVPVVGSLGMGYLLYRFFPMLAAAVFPKPKPPSTLTKAASPFAPFSANFSAPQSPWPAAFPSVVKVLPSRLVRGLPPFSGGLLVCAPKE